MNMSEHKHDEVCKLHPVCNVLFDQVKNGLGLLEKQVVRQHEEITKSMDSLLIKVQNGITDRLVSLERDVALLRSERNKADEERATRLKRMGRWESAIISLVVTATSVLLWFGITEYVKNQAEITRSTITTTGHSTQPAPGPHGKP